MVTFKLYILQRPGCIERGLAIMAIVTYVYKNYARLSGLSLHFGI